jgi:hypothetical protein
LTLRRHYRGRWVNPGERDHERLMVGAPRRSAAVARDATHLSLVLDEIDAAEASQARCECPMIACPR